MKIIAAAGHVGVAAGRLDVTAEDTAATPGHAAMAELIIGSAARR
ncbi:hypothetical protein [Actinobaculum sp. 313]|nr:hypothetical protein [Actinobaculum sp. 313]